MNEHARARPGSDGSRDRARRAYRALLGDEDPAAVLLAAGATDLRLGHGAETPWPDGAVVLSGPEDLAELREVVETVTGVGSWPRPPEVDGATVVRARVAIHRPAAVLGLLLAMEGLIERRSPWGRWRTTVDTLAARVATIDSLGVDLRVVERRS